MSNFSFISVKDQRFKGDEQIHIIHSSDNWLRNAYTGYLFQKSYDGKYTMGVALGWKQCNLSGADMRSLMLKLQELNEEKQ